MTGDAYRSFRLTHSRCPHCGRLAGAVEWRRVSDWIRIPLAAISVTVLYPFVRIWMTCRECGHSFLASDMQ